jgi:hypothetical protein
MALTQKKAKKILRHGTVKDKKVSSKQKKLFGAIAGGRKIKKEKYNG